MRLFGGMQVLQNRLFSAKTEDSPYSSCRCGRQKGNQVEPDTLDAIADPPNSRIHPC